MASAFCELVDNILLISTHQQLSTQSPSKYIFTFPSLININRLLDAVESMSTKNISTPSPFKIYWFHDHSKYINSMFTQNISTPCQLKIYQLHVHLKYIDSMSTQKPHLSTQCPKHNHIHHQMLNTLTTKSCSSNIKMPFNTSRFTFSLLLLI